MWHQAQMREEARELASSQFGPELLQALGEFGAQSCWVDVRMRMYLARSELAPKSLAQSRFHRIYLANEFHGRISLTKGRASMKHNSRLAQGA